MTKKPNKQGRPNKLTPEQKDEIRKRLLSGGRGIGAILAREYEVDEKVIRRIKSEPNTDGDTIRLPVDAIKQAAQKSLQNDLNDPDIKPLLEKAGVKDWDLFQSHKATLLEMTLHLNLAARISAQNAHKLAEMAQNHLSKVETDAILDAETLGTINNAMTLQCHSNESAKQPMKLFEIATKQPPPPPEDKPLRIIGGLPDNV